MAGSPKSKESGKKDQSAGKKNRSPGPAAVPQTTQMMAPSDYEQLYHNEPSLEVKRAGQKLAKGLIQPSNMGGASTTAAEPADPLAVTEFERLPPLVEEQMRAFLKSVPRGYTVPRKLPKD